MEKHSDWCNKLVEILAAHVPSPSPPDTHVESYKDKLVGASFMLVNKDGHLFSGSAGRTGQSNNSEPWTVHTFAWMASLTKLPSAICLLQLVERGYFGLDEDLRVYFRETGLVHLASVQILRGFGIDGQPILEPNTSPITLRHLLTHTCGLGYDLPSEDLMRWSHAVGRQKDNLTWTEEGFSTPLLFEPGTAWLYGSGVDWATQLLEKMTGSTLGEYMEENIFKPLGACNSVFRPGNMRGRGEGRAPDLVNILFREQDGTLHDMDPQPIPSLSDHELESGGAGLFSTTLEYSKVLQGILSGSLLSEESSNLLFEPQLDDRLQQSMMDKVAITPEFAPGFPPGMLANFTFGGMVNLRDIPGKRKALSVTWSGMSNCRWWIDRTTGIAGLMVVSVLPYGDPVATRLFNELERAVYEGVQG